MHKAVRPFTAALLVTALSGCALNVRLLEQGKEHQGTFNPPARAMEVTIDGEKYTGSLSGGSAPGFATMYTPRGPVMATTGVATGQFNATLTSPSGKVIVCQFNSMMGSGSGTCEGLDGRRFAFVQP